MKRMPGLVPAMMFISMLICLAIDEIRGEIAFGAVTIITWVTYLHERRNDKDA